MEKGLGNLFSSSNSSHFFNKPILSGISLSNDKAAIIYFSAGISLIITDTNNIFKIKNLG